MKTGKKFLLVTTAHKGVFAGYGIPTNESTIELTEAKMCVYWSLERYVNTRRVLRHSGHVTLDELKEYAKALRIEPASESAWMEIQL